MIGRFKAAVAAFLAGERRDAQGLALWPDTGGYGATRVINSHAAENLSLVVAAIGVISSALASLPCYVYRAVANGREIDESHPLTRLIEEGVNSHLSWADWIEWTAASVLLKGNAVSEILRDGSGNLIGIDPVPWHNCSLMMLPSGRLAFDITRIHDAWGGTGRPRRLPEGEVFHLKDRSDDGLVGRSRLSRSPAVIDLALNQQHTERFVALNHAAPGGALSAPGHIEDDTAARLKADWEQRFGGRNVGRVAVMGDGLKFEALGFSAEDSEFLASRKFSAEELCRLYQVPPPLVQIYEHNTFTKAHQASLWFAQFTLSAWATQDRGRDQAQRVHGR